ncbi:MAG TPA: tRNA (guanosine(37)-N1)-methyltransferase TrmD [Coriobacteriia bacterium]
MRIDVVTLFPDVFDSVVSSSMLGIARGRGILEFFVHDLRDWALPGVHRQVDDAPYGGGAGMVLRPEPVFAALDAVAALDGRTPLTVLVSPQGERLTQRRAQDLSRHDRLIIVCGRYEGFDERIRSRADLELSIGDYVLTGGELPAMVITDAVTRLLPGVLGDDTSALDESFADGLLEYPHYTRPASFLGMDVPDVLRSGDHAAIAAWRADQAAIRTALRRPDLLKRAWNDLTERQRAAARAAVPHDMEDE